MENIENVQQSQEINANTDQYDVIIIGAGISGLSSAYNLKKNCKRLKILIIEGKDRVGGRTQTVELKCSEDGETSKWDAGGQWVADTQLNITQLLNELNLETYHQFQDGKKVLESNGKLTNYNSSIPSISILSLIDLQMGIMKISSNSKKLSTIDPFENPAFSSKLDATNFEQFLLSRSFSSESRSIIDPAIRTVYGLELNQINTLFGLMYIKSGGGTFESLALAEKGCAQEKRVKGGTQQISAKMLENVLENSNNKIMFNTALIEIKQNENDDSEAEFVEVVAQNTLNGEFVKFRAKKVISSIPINQYVHVKFEPDLPFLKQNVFKFCQMGNLTKFIVTYKRPFWRDAGFSGEVLSDGSILWLKESEIPNFSNDTEIPSTGPIACIFDGTNHNEKAALVGFIGAKMAVEWMDQSAEIRKREIIEALVRYFGNEARDFLDYFEKIWNKEKFSGGCPTVNVSSSGVMKDYAKAVREPFINVHFCGTESATVWQGYMDGAVESGERAANEVLYSFFKKDRSVQCDYEKTYYYQKEVIRSKMTKKQ